jgi:hypothetical protein
MLENIIYSETYGDVVWSPDVPCLITRWHAFANSQQFRSLMDRGLDYFQQKSQQTWPIGWLADARQMSALVPADQLWLETDWNPRAYAAGIQHIGIVTSENIFGRIATQVYAANTTAQSSYIIQPNMFTTLEEAKKWLRQVI